MIEKLPESSGNILGFRSRGKLTESDYLDVLAPGIEQAIAEHGKARVLWIIEGFEGWTVGGAWEDFRLGMKFKAVEKMATVIDESWDEWMTWLFRAFTTLTGTEIRFFKAERLDEAWEWVRS
jgi:hypothetical protein